MWIKHNNKPHSVTMDIRGNKGLFAYFRKFKSIIIDEKTGLFRIKSNINKQINNKKMFTMHIMLSPHYLNIVSRNSDYPKKFDQTTDQNTLTLN